MARADEMVKQQVSLNPCQPVPSSSLLLSSLELRDAKVYEPEMRALLGTASHFCEVNRQVVPSSLGSGPGRDH